MANRVDPYRGFNFRVEFIGVGEAYFSEISGLSFTIDKVDYREGTDKELFVRHLTALRKFDSNLKFMRGFTQDLTLWNWYTQVLGGITERHDGSIVLCDENHDDMLRWEFKNAWICKWEGPAMKASANDVAIETIELCVESVDLKKGG